MTQQEMRARFFAKTGRIATMEPVEYQAFMWGIEFGAEVEREACAKTCEVTDLHRGDFLKDSDPRKTCAEAIRMRSNAELNGGCLQPSDF